MIPLLVMGAAALGAKLFGAHQQASASKKAATQQVAAAEKAQGYLNSSYADQKALMNPYVQAGQTSLANLQARQWGTPTQAPQPSGYGLPPAGYGGAPNHVSLAGMQDPRSVGSGQTPAAAQAMPRPGSGGQPPDGRMPQGGAMVTLQAPTGETMQLPDGDPRMQMLLSKGARRVG